MPPSQLKRLKISLREQGLTGPQKSKKQKKVTAAAKGKNASDRIHKNVAVQQIRESFNPFDARAPARPAKFQHANDVLKTGGRYKDVLHRPGVTKSAGEEMRRATLLPEMQRRHKVGLLVDRRIGEGDPEMTAEEKAVQRFAREKQKKRSTNLFDLDASDDDEPHVNLTHGGRILDDLATDDFDDIRSDGSVGSDDQTPLGKKRPREDMGKGEQDELGAESAEDEPERKKTKTEVMKEVIAKSKLHKYERQKAKEDDDDLRDELDKDMPDVLALLRGLKAPTKFHERGPLINERGPMMNPDRQKLLQGDEATKVDREYEARLKQLAQEARAKPSERIKTEEERAREQAEKLKALEESRIRRMRGEDVSDEEDEVRPDDMIGQGIVVNGVIDADFEEADEATEFGLLSTNREPQQTSTQIVLEDEDDFALDEDLIAGDSDDSIYDMSESGSPASIAADADANGMSEDDEFIKGVIGEEGGNPPEARHQAASARVASLPVTYPCPRSHQELLSLVRDVPVEQLPRVIQSIRALYHPSLDETNKEKISELSAALVEHLYHMGNERQPLAIAEQVIRHLHSLSRAYTERIARAFRIRLRSASERKHLDAGDLVILTAISSIYPTSDHFHPVVTPAMIVISRWLGSTMPDSNRICDTGAFVVALCTQYQRLSRRYIPEAIRFMLHVLGPKTALTEQQLAAHTDNLISLAILWKDKPAFVETFAPFLDLVHIRSVPKAQQTLKILLQTAQNRRRPLELHHHRPQPIRASVPKFEEGFNPDKHYDPDKERSDARKLQKEYKRERKGALRELRKDANFVSRQQLKEKRERDVEYERKYRRLVAEIQSEEGKEGNAYERERAGRKKGRR